MKFCLTSTSVLSPSKSSQRFHDEFLSNNEMDKILRRIEENSKFINETGSFSCSETILNFIRV